MLVCSTNICTAAKAHFLRSAILNYSEASSTQQEWEIMKRRHFLATLLFYIISLGCTADASVVKVTVSSLSSLLIAADNSAPASIVSLNHTLLSAQLGGTVTHVFAQVGDQVTANTALLKIDCRDYLLAEKQAVAGLDAAHAQRDLSHKQYQRSQKLRSSKTIAEDLLEQSLLQLQLARAEVATRKAALVQARLSVERCSLRAPFSGQITERLVHKGQLLAPHTAAFKLLQTQSLEVSAALTPAEIADARQADTLVFVSQGRRIPVTVRAVIREVKSNSKVQHVRLTAGTDNTLLAGDIGRLEWQSRPRLLPADYLSRRNGVLGVMVLKAGVSEQTEGEGVVLFHPLPGALEGQPAVIDLPAETRVIVDNRFRLVAGQRVKWSVIKNQQAPQ